MAKAIQLSNADPGQGGPSQDASILDPSPPHKSDLPTAILVEMIEKGVQDPPVDQEKQMHDFVQPTEIVSAKEEDVPTEAGVPGPREIQADARAWVVGESDVAGQEKKAEEKKDA